MSLDEPMQASDGFSRVEGVILFRIDGFLLLKLFPKAIAREDHQRCTEYTFAFPAKTC